LNNELKEQDIEDERSEIYQLFTNFLEEMKYNRFKNYKVTEYEK